MGVAPAPCVIEPPIKATFTDSPFLALFMALVILSVLPRETRDCLIRFLYASELTSTGSAGINSGAINPSLRYSFTITLALKPGLSNEKRI